MRMYHWKQISKKETAFIKAFGMLFILFHNYSHHVKPWLGENEFSFSYQYTASFLSLIKENPIDISRLLFAFFGHYGVQLFIFISGYGLFLSYKDKPVKWWPFFRKHLVKFYPAYLLAICFYLILFPWHYHTSFHPWVFKFAILDLLFIQNFVPGAVYQLVGPWWFFSLIVQLYAVFPFILILFHRYGIKAVIGIGIIAWIITLCFNSVAGGYGYNLYYFFISRLPVFCLGIYFAWLSDFKLPWWFIASCFVIVLAGNVNNFIWPLTMLAVTIFLLVIIRLLIPVIERSHFLSPFLSWIGINSLFIFAVHGFLRFPFVERATQLNNSFITILIGMAFFIVSILVAWSIKILETPIQRQVVQPYFNRLKKNI